MDFVIKSYKIKEPAFEKIEKEAEKEGIPVNRYVGMIIEKHTEGEGK